MLQNPAICVIMPVAQKPAASRLKSSNLIAVIAQLPIIIYNVPTIDLRYGFLVNPHSWHNLSPKVVRQGFDARGRKFCS